MFSNEKLKAGILFHLRLKHGMRLLLVFIVLGCCVWEGKGLPASGGFSEVDDKAVRAGNIQSARRSQSAFPGVMAVETSYFIEKSPSAVVKALVEWNPVSHEELGILIHAPISQPVVPKNFSSLQLDPGDSQATWLLDRTIDLSSNSSSYPLNLSKEEVEKLAEANNPTSVEQKWKDLLLNRVRQYQEGGLKKQPPYEGQETLDLGKTKMKFLQSVVPLSRNFGNLLTLTLGESGGTEKGVERKYYWEMISVRGDKNFLLGCYMTTKRQDKWFVLDTQYYVSGKFYGSLILYEITPVDGDKGSIIRRMDLVFTPNDFTRKGIAAMAGDNILIQEVKKSIELFRKDIVK